jgi:Arc/MetJ-type ribon-helix-helix transcriptional regulator
VPAKEQFIQRLNAGVRKAGYSNRSQFIRDAIVEKLENHGVKLPGNLAEPPARTWQKKAVKPKSPAAKTRKKK